MYILALVLLILHFKLANYDIRRILIHTSIIAPFVFFSVQMVTEAVTIDELQYIFTFIDPENIKNHGVLSMIVLYEYKFSQIFIGIFFALIPAIIREQLGTTNLAILYKVAHYFLMLIIILLIARVWRTQIFENKEEKRLHASESALLAVLIGLPLSCLLLKVCNYDSGSTYPALLGFSLLWGAYKKKSVAEGFAGTLVTALGVLDKWTALPYWCICVVLFAHLFIENRKGEGIKKYVYGVLAVIISYSAALCISLLELVYANIYQGGLCAPINIGNIAFSFTHAARVILSGDMSVDYYNVNAYNSDAFMYVLIVIFALLGCLFIMEIVFKVLASYHINETNLVNKVCAFILLISIVGGIIAAYCIPLRISPYIAIQEGNYLSTDGFDGWTYHYGAKTATGHFVCKVCYMCATVLCSYPTVVTVLAVVAAVLIIKKEIENTNGNFFAGLFWFCSILLLALYAIAGMPSDARYFSFSIYALIISVIYYLNQFYCHTKLTNRLVVTGSILFVIEMLFYSPNIINFSPIWIIHSNEHNQTIRTGEWYAGESMLWGEELAIGGNKIKNLVDEQNQDMDYSKVNIYTNYGGAWLRKFRDKSFFTVKNVYSGIDEIRFTENAYYIFSKYRLFRGEVPGFINEIVPIDTIEFKGDIGAWIYRGDQLNEYREYFEEINR